MIIFQNHILKGEKASVKVTKHETRRLKEKIEVLNESYFDRSNPE